MMPSNHNNNTTSPSIMYDVDASSSSSIDSVSLADNAVDESNDDTTNNNSNNNKDGSGADDSNTANNNKVFAEKETKHLKCWRIVLVVVLVAVALGVCTGTYLFVQDESNEDYKLSVSDWCAFLLVCCGICHATTFSVTS